MQGLLLTMEVFHKLSAVGVFHPAHMNEAIWQFRLFERASLDYLGIAPRKLAVQHFGLWDHTDSSPDLHKS